MVSYRLRKERFHEFLRTDGISHLMVPVPRCKKCSKPIRQEYESSGLCYDCCFAVNPEDNCLERVIAAALYIPRVNGYNHSQEIIDLKERGLHAPAYANVLLHIMTQERCEPRSDDILVPIPQSSPRGITAGPLALAQALRSLTGAKVKECIRFNREVLKQKKLKSMPERLKNVSGSMDCDVYFTKGRIYLVDDIFTTGSTMKEACRVVHEKNAKIVIGLVAGRDSKPDSLVHAGVIEVVKD